LINKLVKLLNKFRSEFKPRTGEGCKPPLRQLAEVIQLLLRAQLTPEEYYLNRFYKSGIDYSYMLNYLSNFHLTRVYHQKLNDKNWIFLFRNKLLFNSYFSSYGFPLTKLYGYFDCNAGFTPDGAALNNKDHFEAFLRSKKPDSLVVKPVSGISGKKVLIIDEFNYDMNRITCRTRPGLEVDAGWIVEQMLETSGEKLGTGYILEPKIRQHETMNEINPDAVNTVRINTLLDKDNRVHVIYAGLRIGRADSPVDNFSKGGLFVKVDLEDGRLGKGYFNNMEHDGFFTDHPDTGAPFSGKCIPHWAEVIEICSKAAAISPFCRTIGWDMAITPEGPLIVEGNDNHANRFQLLYDGYLQPDIREMLAQLGLKFPEKKLPGFSFSTTFKAIKAWSGL
jgi:hypothetical protein